MANFGNLGFGAVVKNCARVARHPRIAANLLAFEAEKTLLSLPRPISGSGGARRIRVVTFRPTDLCNLRCHICGQWGDRGYQLKKEIRNSRARTFARPVSIFAGRSGPVRTSSDRCAPGWRTHAL